MFGLMPLYMTMHKVMLTLIATPRHLPSSSSSAVELPSPMKIVFLKWLAQLQSDARKPISVGPLARTEEYPAPTDMNSE